MPCKVILVYKSWIWIVLEVHGPLINEVADKAEDFIVNWDLSTIVEAKDPVYQ